MIRLQIVARPGVKLFNDIKRAIRSKDLRTFTLERRGTRVVHVRAPGFMTWEPTEGGLIACEIRTPKDENQEWQLLEKVVGRLAARFPASVESVNIQLEAPPAEPARKRRKGRKAKKRRARARRKR
jgi:hypothetical protein